MDARLANGVHDRLVPLWLFVRAAWHLFRVPDFVAYNFNVGAKRAAPRCALLPPARIRL